jgi:5-formyltetrahydrofolate cyclo-ligase
MASAEDGPKAALRRECEAKLAALDPEVARAAAGRVAERVLALPELARARRILACLSFGSELDTEVLIGGLLAGGWEVYAPRVERGDGRLHAHRYPCALEALSFGLRQPVGSAPELAEETLGATLDLALVLGLAFDRRGYRLGHGRGHFDRFFARHRVPGVGLAFDLQLRDRLPAEPHDVPMRAVVTETALVRPGAA